MRRCAPVVLCFVRQVVFLLLLLGGFGASANPQSLPAQPSRRGTQERLRQEMSFRQGRLPRGATARNAAAALLERAYQQKLSLRHKAVTAYAASSSSSSPTGSSWTSLGPAPLLSNASGGMDEQDYGPVSGRVTAIAVDPNDATGNTVYIGGANGGVWKSTNAAASDATVVTWTPLTDQQASLATGAIAVQPGKPQVILVGTGEANLALDSYYGLGILRSSDSGAHWNLITAADGGHAPFAGLGFSRIVFSTDHPNLVVAGASNFTFYPGSGNSGQGLYYSTDYGTSWHAAAVKDGAASTSQRSITDVAYNSAAADSLLPWPGMASTVQLMR